MAAPVAGQTATVTLRAGPRQVALVELFTSEGCSSCPPAEHWLGARRHDAQLWRAFVPLAFHVNYWDHLGWRDPLAAEAFTERQRRYAAAWGAASVYTPALVRNGVEWHPSASPAAHPGESDVGILTIAWTPTTHTAVVDFAPAAPWGIGAHPPLEASVALLGGGIVSHVRGGENSGRELHHEFAVLRVVSAPLQRGESGRLSAVVVLPPRTDVAASRQALAGWVSAAGHPRPLQAVGGWID